MKYYILLYLWNKNWPQGMKTFDVLIVSFFRKIVNSNCILPCTIQKPQTDEKVWRKIEYPLSNHPSMYISIYPSIHPRIPNFSFYSLNSIYLLSIKWYMYSDKILLQGKYELYVVTGNYNMKFFFKTPFRVTKKKSQSNI